MRQSKTGHHHYFAAARLTGEHRGSTVAAGIQGAKIESAKI
jgi:hypothetical protein